MRDQGADLRLATLRSTPGFASFPAAELETLADLFVEEGFEAGEHLCREGEEGDRLFVVTRGALDVISESEGRRLRTLGPGDLIGEVSLLLGGRRTATVVATRATQVLALHREAFEQSFKRNAKVLEYISRVLSRRLLEQSGRRAAEPSRVVAVTAEPGLRGRSLVAHVLARLLATQAPGATVWVGLRAVDRPEGSPASLGALAAESAAGLESRLKQLGPELAQLEVEIPSQGDPPPGSGDFARLVGALRRRFGHVVLDLAGPGRVAARWADAVGDVHVRIVAEAEPGPARRDGTGRRRYDVVNLHNRVSRPIPIRHAEPFVLPRDARIARRDAGAAAEQLCEEPSAPIALPLKRLARKILGTSVGLALGGGAAFGVAHLGVLRVLEEQAIPIDLVIGTSMGSVVGMGYAAGTPIDEMIAFAESITPWSAFGILDLTPLQAGVVGGRGFIRKAWRLFGEAPSFEALQRPFQAVATDIERGERVCLGSGDVESAIRASCSVPAIVAPTQREGRVLVDGVTTDPVPADVAYEMGADLCIAVNVIPRPRKEVSNFLTRMSRRVARYNPLIRLRGNLDAPNLFDVYMASLQTQWHELGSFRSMSADVRVMPELSDFTWTDLHRGAELVERGAAAAELALPAIRAAMAEKRGGLP